MPSVILLVYYENYYADHVRAEIREMRAWFKKCTFSQDAQTEITTNNHSEALMVKYFVSNMTKHFCNHKTKSFLLETSDSMFVNSF